MEAVSPLPQSGPQGSTTQMKRRMTTTMEKVAEEVS
jgi:hypothetical protein